MDENRDPGEICVDCGICCSGDLFDFAPLLSDEVDHAASIGLDVGERNGKPVYRFRCPQLDGAICQVYDERPHVCRTFRCSTLRGLEAGDLSYPEAQSRVRQALAATEQVRQLLASGQTIPGLRALRKESIGKGKINDQEVSAMALMKLGMLDLILDKYFRHDKRRVFAAEGDNPVD